jgi:hypothetical protein
MRYLVLLLALSCAPAHAAGVLPPVQRATVPDTFAQHDETCRACTLDAAAAVAFKAAGQRLICDYSCFAVAAGSDLTGCNYLEQAQQCRVCHTACTVAQLRSAAGCYECPKCSFKWDQCGGGECLAAVEHTPVICCIIVLSCAVVSQALAYTVG